MEYSINKLAQMAGVTTRTLRHYHQIGLLAPSRISTAGYRIYGQAEVNRLQQIMFYRETGMELSRIKDLLDSPGFDAAAALEEHLQTLLKQRARLDTLIQNAQHTLLAEKGETIMENKDKFKGFTQKLIQENEEKYGEEIRQKYGDEAVDASNAKMFTMSEEKYAAFSKLSEDLNLAIQKAVEAGNPEGEEAMQAAALHKEWLLLTWPSYSPEAHKGLADMYVADERFAAYYENIAPGGAIFLQKAIHCYINSQK